MSTYVTEVLLTLLGGAGVAIWYLLQRNIEKRPVNEEIDRVKRLAELKAALDQNSYSIEDLRKLEAQLMGRSVAAGQLSATFAEEALRVRQALMSKADCQAELSMAAYDAYQLSEKRLEQALRNLKLYMGPEEIEVLDASQAAWRSYQEKYAECVTLQYEGGTIGPMFRANELENITISRVIELEAEYSRRSELLVPFEESA